jgi:glycine hydroxymethyltransferase
LSGLDLEGRHGMTFTTGERHDPGILRAAHDLVHGGLSSEQVVQQVYELTRQNEHWRGSQCVNLIAAESPTSPLVRALLAAEIGTRASGGHIGPLSRCFPGMRYLDQIEAICVELLKELFQAEFTDQRLMGGMAGCAVAYAALGEPGAVMMSLPLSAGGDSSGREDGPAGVRGMRIMDIPFDPAELTVDLDAFRLAAERLRPAVVSINQTTTLFPLPIQQLKEIIRPWGGRLYFDGAHEAGLIAGGCYPDPLAAGADILTGSAGKSFSGPQSGIIAWNDEALSMRIVEAIFPVLTGSHQFNRVAALAVAAAEMREFGPDYMRDVVANARSLAAALDERGFLVVGARRGYTATHQVLVDVRDCGGGLAAAQALERANIMVNKMLLPSGAEQAETVPGGIRIGTVEVTRLGLVAADMPVIAEFIHQVLVQGAEPSAVAAKVKEFRAGFTTLGYCFSASSRTRLPADPAVLGEPGQNDRGSGAVLVRPGQAAASSWSAVAMRLFQERMLSSNRPFPCIFGVDAVRNATLRYAFIPVGDDRVRSLAQALREFTEVARSLGNRTSLACIFEHDPALVSLAACREHFWSLLQQLHYVDSQPWPDGIPQDTEDSLWEFSFNSVPMFVVANTPYHASRASRYFEYFTITFQPRFVFDDLLDGTPTGDKARKVIRRRLNAFDALAPSPMLGGYGSPGVKEWYQYFLPDDNQESNQDARCPLHMKGTSDG